jgi:hypothetical protein
MRTDASAVLQILDKLLAGEPVTFPIFSRKTVLLLLIMAIPAP